MKTLLSIIILTAALGWSPAAEILQHGQRNVAAANASALNQAAQLAAVSGHPYTVNRQTVDSVIEQLKLLGYLCELDCARIRQTSGLLEPVGSFGSWAEVEFMVTGN